MCNPAMRTNLALAFALAAGFLGGLASRYWSPAPVYAQGQTTPPTEIQAQKFVLVDSNGAARAVFGFETNGSPVIEIADSKGRVFTLRWYPTRGKDFFHNPPSTPHKTTLLS